MATLKDAQGRYRTASLFTETNTDSSFTPICSLQDAHDLYIECADPTEYEFATALLGDWQHWKRLREAPFFKALLTDWREELEVKLRATGLRSLLKTASTGDAKGTAAAKWIAEGSWRDHKRGRPSKAEVERTKKVEAGISAEVGEDYERLGIH